MSKLPVKKSWVWRPEAALDITDLLVIWNTGPKPMHHLKKVKFEQFEFIHNIEKVDKVADLDTLIQIAIIDEIVFQRGQGFNFGLLPSDFILIQPSQIHFQRHN